MPFTQICILRKHPHTDSRPSASSVSFSKLFSVFEKLSRKDMQQEQGSTVLDPLLPQQGSTALDPLLPLPSKHDESEKLSIDEVLQEWVGEFGPAQMLHFTLVSFVWCLHGVLTFTMVFTDRTPQWVCAAPASRIVDTGPSCTPSSSICSLEPSQWNWVHGKGDSVVSQWGLFCSDSFKVGLVQCFYFIGSMLGCGVWGSLSDSFLGRRGVMMATSSLGSILGVLTALAPNYWVYFVLRTLTGVCAGGMGVSAFVLATELVGPSKRGTVGMSIFFFYSCSIIYVSVVAYFVSYGWRLLYLLNSAPFVLYCFAILPWVRESPRWYLARGDAGTALAILKQVALRNGRTIPETITLKLDHTMDPEGGEVDTSSLRKTRTLDIFRISSLRKRMLIMLFIWLSNGLSYYGINLNVPNVGGNISLGLILNAVGEMPAYVVTAVMLQRLGRRPALVCALLVCAVSSLAGALIRGARARMACEMMAIFGVAAAYNLVYIYTAELFPTEVRNAAMGLAAQAAQVGSIAAPLVALASNVGGWIPFAIFFITSIISSFLACCLPETLKTMMHETIEGMLKCRDPL